MEVAEKPKEEASTEKDTAGKKEKKEKRHTRSEKKKESKTDTDEKLIISTPPPSPQLDRSTEAASPSVSPRRAAERQQELGKGEIELTAITSQEDQFSAEQKERTRRLWQDAKAGSVDAVKAVLAEEGGNKPASVLTYTEASRTCSIDNHVKPGCTPLCIASCLGKFDVVKLLIEQGAPVDGCDQGNITPLRLAVRYHHIQVVQYLCDNGANLNTKDQYSGVTPLIRSVFDNEFNIAKLLLEKGADPNVTTNDHRNAFYYARTKEIANLLLDHGLQLAEKRVTAQGWMTPLHTAACLNRKGVCEVLLDRLKVDVNLGCGDGDTPLHGAVNKAPELVMWLIERGADPLRENDDGVSPLVLAGSVAWPDSEITTAKEHQDADKMKQIYMTLLQKTDIHPFGYQTKKSDEPFILQLARIAPRAVEPTMARLRIGGGTWNRVQYDRFNFAFKKEEHYNYLKSAEGRHATLRVLKSKNKVVLNTLAMRAFCNAFWSHYVRKQIVKRLFIYILLLLSVCIFVNVDPGLPRRVMSGIVLGITALHLASEIRDAIKLKVTRVHLFRRSFVVPGYVTDAWNYGDLTFLGILTWITIWTVIQPTDLNHWSTIQRQFLGFSVLYVWTKGLEHIGAFDLTSRTARLAINMWWVILRFLAILSLSVLAFAHAFYTIVGTTVPGYIDFGTSLITTYRSFLGDEQFADVADDPAAVVIFVLCTVVQFVLLMNLLIATMAHAYEKVTKNVEHEIMLSRANAVQKILLIHASSDSKWQKLVDTILFHQDKGMARVYSPQVIDPKEFEERRYVHGLMTYAVFLPSIHDEEEDEVLTQVKAMKFSMELKLAEIEANHKAEIEKAMNEIKQLLSHINKE